MIYSGENPNTKGIVVMYGEMHFIRFFALLS